jgi:gamma-glutamylcyclotransferase (GGCT)/AIG2-like uncharacterized protein YtfP
MLETNTPIAPTAPAQVLLTVPAGQRLFFVYGTLRQSGANDITRLQPAPQFIGRTQISGTMVHLGAYPGVTLGAEGDTLGSGVGSVVGEVYAVSPELERKLDAIESEYPASTDEYAKRDIMVLVNGQNLPCSVYEINPAYAQGKPVIASGDWIESAGQ